MKDPTHTHDPEKVLFSFSPEASFTRTFGWMVCALPVAIGVVAAFADLAADQSSTTIVVTLVLSGLAFVVLLVLSRLVDRAQSRIRLEIRGDGMLVFRNVLGRERRVPLVGARSLNVRALRGKPRILGRTDEGGFNVRRTSMAEYVPHFMEIIVRDERGRRHRFTLSGMLPREDLRRFYDVADDFVPLT
ncbi:MAG: hypothetical protein ACRDKZ_14830 [Actinomycetota bacterium]